MGLSTWLPFSYTFATRVRSYRTLLGVLATEHFVILYLVYLSLYGLAFSASNVTRGVLEVLLTYAAFYCVYEIGYVVNDQVSTKFEKSPVIRETSGPKIPAFALARVVWFALLSFILGQEFDVSVGRIIAVAAMLLAVHLVHNFITIRDFEARYYTFSVLRITRYTFVVIALVPAAELNTLIVMLPPLIHSLMQYTKTHLSYTAVVTPLSFVSRYSLILPVQVALLWYGNLPLLVPNAVIILGFLVLLLVTKNREFNLAR